MLSIKGFCTRKRQANNSPGQTAVFGELSTYARTFSKDIGIYAHTQYPEIELNLFSHRFQGQPQGILDTAFAEAILAITDWIYQQSTLINDQIDKNDYLINLHNRFYSEIEHPEIGTIKAAEGRVMPVWFSFKLKHSQDNYVKIWLSSASMEADYDEYDITVVSPLLHVDTLFRPANEIRAALATVPLTDQMDKVQTAKEQAPETVIRVETLQRVDPTNAQLSIDTHWYLLIYGPAGNNSEAIKQAIIQYILANSNEPEEAWKKILPFLFKTTRMFVLPRWDLMAIANRQTQVGIYAPTQSVTGALTYAKTALSHLPTTFVEEHLQSTHHKWRSISLLTCGHTDNAQEKYKLTDYVPDYIAESSTSQDFNRMSEVSKRWTVMMQEMLMIAEDIEKVNQLPVEIRKVQINQVWYISKRFGAVEFLVALKGQ